jgi:hypothetical protein
VKRLILVLALLGMGLAQPLEDFLERAYLRDLQYQTRAFQVESAEAHLALKKADPYATPYEFNVAAAQLELSLFDKALTRAEAQARALDAYVAVLLSRQQLSILKARLELLSLRFQEAMANGDTSVMAQATQEIRRYSRDLQRVWQNDFRFALKTLLDYYGHVAVELLKPPPPLDLQSLSIEAHPHRIGMIRAVERAELDYQLAQGPSTSPDQLRSRQRALESARADLRSLEHMLTLTLEQSKVRYSAEQANSSQAAASAEEVQAELESVGGHYQAGEVSEIDLKQAELRYLEVQEAHQRALVELWRRYFEVLRNAGGQQQAL